MFISLLDSVGFAQRVNKPTHCFNNTLNLVLTYGIETEHLIIFPKYPLLSDQCLITSEFLLLDYTPLGKNVFTRFLSDSAVAKFKEVMPSVLNSLPFHDITAYANFSSSQIDQLVDSASGSMRTTLDSIAPLEKKKLKQRRVNSQTRILKQTT